LPGRSQKCPFLERCAHYRQHQEIDHNPQKRSTGLVLGDKPRGRRVDWTKLAWMLT
jgi:hypothetical protein